MSMPNNILRRVQIFDVQNQKIRKEMIIAAIFLL